MVVRRGEIWWAELGEPRGSGPGYRRPVLVIQANVFNASAIQTVVVAVITTNLRLAHAPGNVLLSRRQSNLPKDSTINVSQLVSIDKADLVERVTSLSPALIALVDAGIRLVLSV